MVIANSIFDPSTPLFRRQPSTDYYDINLIMKSNNIKL